MLGAIPAGSQQLYLPLGTAVPRKEDSVFEVILNGGRQPESAVTARSYEEYIKIMDSATESALARIEAGLNNRTLSRELAQHLRIRLKYTQLEWILSRQYYSSQHLLPATHSRIYPTVSLAEFSNDKYLFFRQYVDCAVRYLECRCVFSWQDDNRINSLTKEIDFCIGNLAGETRTRVLHSLIVERQYKTTNDPAAFTALYKRIRALHLHGRFAEEIDRQYKRAMREHAPLDAQLLDEPLLESPGGGMVSLRSLMDTARGKTTFIKFIGGHLDDPGSFNYHPAIPNGRVITIHLYHLAEDWENEVKDRNPANTFYMPEGFESPLAKELFIREYWATWVALSSEGVIDNISLSPKDIDRYNKTGH